MIDPNEPFPETTVENSGRRTAQQGPPRSLSIAILGPTYAGGNPGGRKRQQIRRELREAGHRPFYPEEQIGAVEHYLPRELAILSTPDVDLIIVLQTGISRGVHTELGALATQDVLLAKTAVLTPAEDYLPDQGFLENTISYFRVQIPYTESQFEECSLISHCWAIIDDLLSDNSPLVLDPEL